MFGFRSFFTLSPRPPVTPSLLALALLFANTPAHAHPVPRRQHDRTIVVKLTPKAVLVEYRLEVDEFTVVFDDLPAAASSEDLAKLSKPVDFYDAFTRYYAPILADNLLATLDQKPLAFRCRERHQSVRD